MENISINGHDSLNCELGVAKARFAALAETMDYNSFVVVLWDADSLNTNFISGNIGNLGIRSNNLTHMGDWAESVHPDDIDDFWARRKPLLDCSSNVDFWHEYRIINKNGEVRWLNERLTFISAPGSKLYRSIFIDTTARHEHDNLGKHIKYTDGSLSGDTLILDIVSLDFLQELCDSVAESLDVSSLILDSSGNALTKRKRECELCSMICGTEKGASLCGMSDNNLCIAARNTGGLVIEPCDNTGFYDAAAPIIVSGRLLGFWIIGQVRVENTINEDNIRVLSKKLSLDENAAVEAFNSMPERSLEETKKLFSLLEPYVNELSEYLHRSYLLMHEAERMVKSQDFVSKSLKIEKLQNHLYELFFSAHHGGGRTRFRDALESISGYFGFNRAFIVRKQGNRFEPLEQWQETGRGDLSPAQLDNDTLSAVCGFCESSSSVKSLDKSLFPSSWSSDLKNLGAGICYLYSVENKGKSIGVICMMQDEDRPELSQDERDSLTNIVSSLGAYIIMKQIEQRMRETTESLHMILNNLSDSIYVVDRTTYELVFANTNFDGQKISGPRGVACYRILGYDSPCSCCGLEMLKDQPDGYSYSFETEEGGMWQLLTMTVMEWIGGRPVYLVSNRDITEEKLRQRQLVEAATFDSLLNIPNISRLTSRLEFLCSEAESGSLFAIDIDNLRLINNAYGHEYGDILLKEITYYLKSYMPRGEFVYRYATKTFAVLFEDDDEKKADDFVKNLYERFGKPWKLKDKICYSTFSAAMVHYNENSKGAVEVMRNISIALERSIDHGRNSFYALTDVFPNDHAERLELANDLHKMINEGCNELVVHYQPVFDVNINRVVYMEALMRWNHPNKGLISPLKFIELAEDASLIAPLSEKLIEIAVEQCIKWQEKEPEIKLSVNFSAAHSRQEGIVSKISRILKEKKFRASDLIIEVNEKDTINDQLHLFAFMRELQGLGCRVALDNFGTGMSSLGKLHSMPVNAIKIDRCFINNICESDYDRAVVKFLANLPLALEIVCEGVETREQLEVIKELGVSMCQGYYLGRPLPENEIKL